MDLTIHHLRCFLAVAEERHFGRAAARLHLSSSAVSEQIAALERRLARTLFQRTSRSVEPTEHGRELEPRAREAVAAMDEVLAWARKTADEPGVRVGLMVSSPRFRRTMAAVADELPQVRWQIRQLGFLGCHDALAGGEVDCAFVAELGRNPSPAFESVPLWEERCVLVVPDRHPLAGRESVRLADLDGETFVSVEDETAARHWSSPLTEAGINPELLPIARNFEEVLELCGAGQGVNVAGESAPETYARPGLAFVPIEDSPPATTYLYLRRERHSGALERLARIAVGLGDAPG
ncbi:LysR family transcriptional regulator [Amycolatopsis roodepoortensis]|uniref:DNA-binding transcriptional LysR family regulator n=1 Tax=Amycolatopsis roodepoortensis TaxID=700274 RepID=A0ABR9L0Y5_9PSEU|nr:LysR substrate-binding domain-containing protein [Amycolatopsis roodepoortensis]MBE1574285.1 DNA-binding transcriptional LysR family regulator [Amycolatopsis roodepoortensis]